MKQQHVTTRTADHGSGMLGPDDSRRHRHDPSAATLSLHQLKHHLADPAPFYASLPKPLYWDRILNSWVCTGYAEAEQVLGDARSFGAARLRSNHDFKQLHHAAMVPVNTLLAQQMLFLDGKTHQQLKRLLLPHFQPKAVNALTQHIHTVVHTLLAPYIQAERMDEETAWLWVRSPLLLGSCSGFP